MKIQVFCPECEQILQVGPRVNKGQRLICSRCNTQLITTKVNPVEVDLASNHQVDTNNKKAKTVDLACPECETFIRLSINVRAGQQLNCPQCYSVLEVVSIDPIELEVALGLPKMKVRPSKKLERRKEPHKREKKQRKIKKRQKIKS